MPETARGAGIGVSPHQLASEAGPNILQCGAAREAAKFVDELRNAGHDIELVAPFIILMGHAGALVRIADGAFEGAADPRRDGAAAAF